MPALQTSTGEAALPLVSVVLPVFNAAPYLRQAIDSVLDQNYPNIELIAVDDGSTDGSREILAEYGSRLRVVFQHNLGPAAARNLGVRASTGSFVAFLDADDLWLPGKLAGQVRYMLGHPSTKITFGQFAFWEPGADGTFPQPHQFLHRPETWQIAQELSGWIYVELLEDSVIHIITAMIQREVFDALGGFDESLRGGSDYDFWLRASVLFPAHKLPTCMALYRILGTGVTGTAKTTNYPYLVLKRAIENHGLTGPDGRRADEKMLRSRLGQTWFNFAQLHLIKGDRKLGRDALRKYLAWSRYRPAALLSSLQLTLRTRATARPTR